MYSVVRVYKMKSAGDVDKVVNAARAGFLPIVTKAPGFIAYTMAAAPDGALVTIGMFADRAGAEESTRLAADWVRDNVASFVEGPPKISEGEVRIQERRAEDATYGVLRRVKLQPGKVNEALEMMRTKLVPMLSSLPGFSRVAVFESGPDELLSLAAWRDRASAEEATRHAMAFMQENGGDIVAGPPEMIDADIKLREVNEAALQPN